MESIAIGKNLAATNGYDIDAGQEMLALGIANVVGVAGPFKKYIFWGRWMHWNCVKRWLR